jgi:hypothetical protein
VDGSAGPLSTWRERLKRRRAARRLRRRMIPFSLWLAGTRRLPSLHPLQTKDRVRLRALTADFLSEKVFTGAQGLDVDDAMRVSIAAQACLLIVNMQRGLAPFSGWTEVIVYPDTFRVRREVVDEAGVLHVSDDDLAGESWDRGPVILSWGDIEADGPGTCLYGSVILHEFAHKLDALRGAASGMPPLHRDMDAAHWTRVFSAAYEQLCAAVDSGLETAIDPYAAEAPEEFFAVVTEYVFEDPDTLAEAFPEVFEQLAQYYRLEAVPPRSAPGQQGQPYLNGRLS